MQVCRGKIRKAKLQNKTWLGRNRKGNETAPYQEEGEGKGCATAQPGGKAFRCTTEQTKTLNAFLFQPSLKEILCILTSAKLLRFVKGDLGKAAIRE